jgi:hypothetical protein
MSSKFWLENIKELGKNITLIPKASESLENKMNTITRIVILLAILMTLMMDYKTGILFLCLSLIFVITFYYNNKEVLKEKFEFIKYNSKDKIMNSKSNLSIPYQAYQKVNQSLNFPPRSGQFATPTQPLQNNQTQYSLSQQLAQGRTFMSPYVCEANGNQSTTQFESKPSVNPNTLKAPVYVAPIYDLTYWRDNDFVGYSRINEERIQDKYKSGYFITDRRCRYKNGTSKDPYQIGNSVGQPNGQFDDIAYPISQTNNEKYNNRNKYEITTRDIERKRVKDEQKNLIEGFNRDYLTAYNKDNISPIIEPIGSNFPYVDGVDILEDESYQQPGDVLTIAGYNPNNLKYNLPANAAFGECEKQKVYDEYNKNIYTQTIQPGYLSRSQIIEPISSNIGISFDQQFLPTELKREGNDLVYQEYDPRQFKAKPFPVNNDVVSQDNVYDPRYTGNGTSYRTYVDRLTGQPRFYYDDVDAIRRPNYLTRNKLDTFDFGETYGPMKSQGEMINDNDDIRQKAQEKFLNDSLLFRTGLQESLMRKRNNEMWEVRKFPKSRAGNTSCKI